jgi:hypothetical protein
MKKLSNDTFLVQKERLGEKDHHLHKNTDVFTLKS